MTTCNHIHNNSGFRVIDGKLCRRMEISDVYTEGDYSLGLEGLARPVKNCIGRKVNKAELGYGWTPREHTSESLSLAKQRLG